MAVRRLASRRIYYYIVGVLTLVIGVIGATSFTLFRLRDDVLDAQFEIAALLARAFEDHLTQSLNVVDLTLANLAELDVTVEGRQKTTQSLREALRYAPYLRSIAILDARSRIVASSNPANIGASIPTVDYQPRVAAPTEVLRVGTTRSGRDFEPDPVAGANSAPESSGSSFLPVARDVPRGGTWTTMLAALNVDYYLNHYSANIPIEAGIVELLRYDGLQLLSTGDKDGPNKIFANDKVLTRMPQSEFGRFEESSADGLEVLTAFRASRHHPFVIVVHLDKKQSLSRWRQEAIATFGLVSAVLLTVILLAIAGFVRGERAERELLAADERLRLAASVFDNSREAIVITAPDAKILGVNAAFTAITGYSTEEVLGCNPRFLASGQHNKSFYQQLWRSIAECGYWQGEISNRRKDGSIYTESLIICRVLDEHKQPVNYVGVFTDISERKQAESELRLAAVTFETQEGVMITDADTKIIRVNAAFTQTTGYEASEVIGKTPAVFKSGRQDAAFYDAMYDCLRRTGRWQGEIWNRRKNGDIYPEWLTISAVRAPGNGVANYVAIFSDITERKRVENALRESEDRFRSLTEMSSDFFWETDSAHRVTRRWSAKRQSTLSAFHIGAQVGERRWEIPYLTPDEAGWEAYRATLDAHAPFRNFELSRLGTDDTVHHVSLSGDPIFDASDAFCGYRGVGTDITVRKSQEKELQRLNEDLERRVAQRTNALEVANKELEAFSYSVSHDLRAPLRAIQGFSRIVEQQYARQIDEQGRNMLRRVGAGAQRMGLLIDDLLNLSRISRQTMRVGPVNLSALVEEVAVELQAEAPKRKVEWVIAPQVMAEGDPGLLKVALQNLINNAWKYSSKREIARIEFGISERDGRPAYFVRDNGDGFDMAYADKLFEAFQRLHSPAEFSGTGIGLATVKRIVQRHGGEVGAEGRVGEGATFYFTL